MKNIKLQGSDDQWDGDIYSNPAYSRLQRHFEDKVFASEIVPREKEKPHHKILEVGCGGGYLTGKIQQTFKSDVLGVDASVSMLNIARNTYRDNPNILFKQMDISASDNDLAHNDVDAMISFFCFHWVVKQKAALTNVMKTLKEGAHGYIFFPGRAHFPSNPSTKKSYIDLAKDIIANDSDFAGVFSEFTIERIKLCADNFKDFVKESGLNLTEILAINEKFIFEDLNELSRFYHGILAGYLRFVDQSTSNKEKMFYVNKLCDKVASRLIAQGTYKLLENGQVESDEDFLLAIIEKPNYELILKSLSIPNLNDELLQNKSVSLKK